jgi:FkbM family methyltransferase
MESSCLHPSCHAIPMNRKRSLRFFTGAYSLARSANLLQTSWAKRAFASSYFIYKRFLEDPFWNLTHRRPELIENGDVLDIGANIGYTSYLFAGVLKPGFNVYSFEPDWANFQMLLGMIQRKKLRNKIIAVNAAVGSNEGTVEFWHNEEHSGDHRVVTNHFKGRCANPNRISSVPLMSIDSFVSARNLEKISFIKIDVQGYELAVCTGMKQTLARFPEVCVCCEYSPQGLVDLGFEPSQVLNFLRANGHQIHILTRSAITLARDDAAIHRATDEAGYVDLLCSRRALL